MRDPSLVGADHLAPMAPTVEAPDLRTPWPGVLVSAVLFALAHGLGSAWGFADLVFFASVASWLSLRTGGLEAGIAMHTRG